MSKLRANYKQARWRSVSRSPPTIINYNNNINLIRPWPLPFHSYSRTNSTKYQGYVTVITGFRLLYTHPFRADRHEQARRISRAKVQARLRHQCHRANDSPRELRVD